MLRESKPVMLKKTFKRWHIYSKPWKKTSSHLDPYVGWNALRLSNQHKELILTIRTLWVNVATDFGDGIAKQKSWNGSIFHDFSLMRGNSMMCFVGRGRFGNKPLLREINGQPMGRKSTTPLISLSASLLAVWFKVEDEGCHHFKCPMFTRGLPLKPHPAYSIGVVHLETPEWSLLPWPGSTYPRRAIVGGSPFGQIVVTRVQAKDWSTFS